MPCGGRFSVGGTLDFPRVGGDQLVEPFASFIERFVVDVVYDDVESLKRRLERDLRSQDAGTENGDSANLCAHYRCLTSAGNVTVPIHLKYRVYVMQ